MKINQVAQVLGAQKTIITNEGVTNDYSKLYYLNEADGDKDQIGQCPSSLGINQEMFESIKAYKFPCELVLSLATVTAGGGKTQLKVLGIKKPSVKSSPTT